MYRQVNHRLTSMLGISHALLLIINRVAVVFSVPCFLLAPSSSRPFFSPLCRVRPCPPRQSHACRGQSPPGPRLRPTSCCECGCGRSPDVCIHPHAGSWRRIGLETGDERTSRFRDSRPTSAPSPGTPSPTRLTHSHQARQCRFPGRSGRNDGGRDRCVWWGRKVMT